MLEQIIPIQQQIEKVNQALRMVPALMQQGAKRAFKTHGHGFVRTFTRTRLTGRPGLARRTGALTRGFQYSVLEETGRITLRVWVTGEARKYAPVHEYGKQGHDAIKPKRRKFLAIPVGPALTPAGVARYTSPTEVADLQFMKRKGGKPFLGKVEGDSVKVYFLLRKKVDIPPRLKLGETWQDQAPKVVPLLEREAHAALSQKFKALPG